MGTFSLTAQNVGGDPFVSGGNINITNNSFSELEFVDVDNLLGVVQTGEYVRIAGVQYDYVFLGYGDVRGDPNQTAAFIRIDNNDGTFSTVAIDMNNDGDDIPNLSNGNTKLKVAGLDTSSPDSWPVPMCFTPGTLILTPSGYVEIEKLKKGDHVITLDSGEQPVRRLFKTQVIGHGRMAPVRFEAGAFGNIHPLTVSPQHRMLVASPQMALLFGFGQSLVAAKHLVNGRDILVAPQALVTYIHIMFDDHQLVMANGAWSESFHSGARPNATSDSAMTEISELFPDLCGRAATGSSVRPVLKSYEAKLLQFA